MSPAFNLYGCTLIGMLSKHFTCLSFRHVKHTDINYETLCRAAITLQLRNESWLICVCYCLIICLLLSIYAPTFQLSFWNQEFSWMHRGTFFFEKKASRDYLEAWTSCSTYFLCLPDGRLVIGWCRVWKDVCNHILYILVIFIEYNKPAWGWNTLSLKIRSRLWFELHSSGA